MDIKSIVDNIDAQIDTYTSETTHMPRTLVHHKVLNTDGIIVKDNINDPKNEEKGNGFMVKWKNFGYMQWFPYEALANDDSLIGLKQNEDTVKIIVIK